MVQYLVAKAEEWLLLRLISLYGSSVNLHILHQSKSPPVFVFVSSYIEIPHPTIKQAPARKNYQVRTE